MLAILFLIAGVIIFVKGRVQVSKKRTIHGRPVKILGLVYVFAGLAGYGGTASATQGATLISYITLGLYAFAIICTLYTVIFIKGEEEQPISNRKNSEPWYRRKLW